MDARLIRTVLGTALWLLVSMGARYRSANFIVETADPRFAQVCAETAEKYRHDLAIEWLGQEMPNWWQPCPVTILVGPNLGAGGKTQFVFNGGEVYGWVMSIQGSPERVLDSVIPHEVTHMIFASHFRRPLPRWADEGGATSVEHANERNKHRVMLDQFLRTGRGISFSRMFTMMDYPSPSEIMPLYAEGYSLAEYLIQLGGRRKYVEFLDDALKSGDWPGAIRRNYGPQDLGQLQNNWLAWIKQGSPITRQPGNPATAGDTPVLLASHSAPGTMSAATNLRSVPGLRSAPNLRSVAGLRSAPGLSGGAAGTLRGRDAPQFPSDVKLVGRLVPVPNPLLRNSSPARTKAFVQTGMPGSSVYAPRSAAAANQVAVAPAVLSTDGWRPRGSQASTAILAAAAPNTTQVTRPQPVEEPKQVILEWSAR
jgi:hypothetical protein